MSDRGCSVAGCDRKHRAKGLCNPHYEAQRTTGRECTFDGCGRQLASSGLCQSHAKMRLRGEELRPIEVQFKSETGECSVGGCDRPHHSRGYCVNHDRNQRRGWDLKPIQVQNHSESIEDRIWLYVLKDPESGCWIWTRHTDSNGYGRFSYKNEYLSVHRTVWELLRSEIPDGKIMDHLCHNPPCCNPDHLRAVTYGDNNHNKISGVGIGLSGYRNVYKSRDKWMAAINVEGVHVNLGYFTDPAEASTIVKEYRKTHKIIADSTKETEWRL